MDFGIFNLVNRRGRDQDPGVLIRESVRQTQQAEQAGFGISWFAEHHYSNYSLTPSPLLMIAHCAATTSRIRLGSGVVLGCLYEPARFVGEVAYTDQLCEGRLVLGVGSGYQAHELARFGVDLEHARERTDEMLDILDLAFAEGVVEYHGRHFSLPRTELSVPAFRKSGPTIWLAGNSPESCALAARHGYPLFSSGFGMPIKVLADVRGHYEAAWREAGRRAADMHYGVLRFGYVSDDRAEALRFADNAQYQLRMSRFLRKGQTALDSAFLPEEPFQGEASPEEIARRNPIGGPAEVVDKILAEIEATGPRHFGFIMAMGGMSHAEIMRSIDRFGADVIPAVNNALAAQGSAAAAQ
ncbi:MAG: LLM class flavin-dependent oxidoreductase [Alphaproteobacteria bacterium]